MSVAEGAWPFTMRPVRDHPAPDRAAQPVHDKAEESKFPFSFRSSLPGTPSATASSSTSPWVSVLQDHLIENS
jgi:hypothetical protein